MKYKKNRFIIFYVFNIILLFVVLLLAVPTSKLLKKINIDDLITHEFKLEEINKYDVLIVCAGMEGALATVVGGLLAQPIIAVPVSVGYGVSKDGETALNSMLSSCSPGIAVMNIDNGYGAAMAALRIIKSIS